MSCHESVSHHNMCKMHKWLLMLPGTFTNLPRTTLKGVSYGFWPPPQGLLDVRYSSARCRGRVLRTPSLADINSSKSASSVDIILRNSFGFFLFKFHPFPWDVFLTRNFTFECVITKIWKSLRNDLKWCESLLFRDSAMRDIKVGDLKEINFLMIECFFENMRIEWICAFCILINIE